MAETCGGHNVADAVEHLLAGSAGIAVAQADCHLISHRTPDGRNFKAVGQAVVDKDASRQRKYLSLVLQAAERRREYQAVVIPLKIGSRMMSAVMVFLHAEPFVANQSIPIHHNMKLSVVSSNLRQEMAVNFTATAKLIKIRINSVNLNNNLTTIMEAFVPL